MQCLQAHQSVAGGLGGGRGDDAVQEASPARQMFEEAGEYDVAPTGTSSHAGSGMMLSKSAKLTFLDGDGAA